MRAIGKIYDRKWYFIDESSLVVRGETSEEIGDRFKKCRGHHCFIEERSAG